MFKVVTAGTDGASQGRRGSVGRRGVGVSPRANRGPVPTNLVSSAVYLVERLASQVDARWYFSEMPQWNRAVLFHINLWELTRKLIARYISCHRKSEHFNTSPISLLFPMAVPPELAPTPLLTEKHSGVPSRLTKEAEAARARLYGNRTLPASRPRQNGVRLPPDTTQEAFDIAITELKALLGRENVEISDKALIDGWYLEHPNTHDAFHIVEQEELVSSAVVFPGSTEEVQSVVRWANKHSIPIYPISIGRNVGYGGAAPRVPGSVVVDLGQRMNKVLKLDGENASCVVEPGVTYFGLYEEIQKQNLPLWIDCPDLGGGSVLGNAIDRGVGYTPYGDHFANHCGMEVVLPNGELLRTGMGAMPGKNGEDNPTWQAFQPAFGPHVDGIFSQSNFGIITKMGFWLMPDTPHQSYCFTFPKDEDFEQIVDIIRPLAQQRILGNIPQLRHIIQELNVTGQRKSTFHDSHSPMTREEIRKAAKDLPLGDCSWVSTSVSFSETNKHS